MSARPYQTVRMLVDRHRGRAAVVMGGGPSLTRAAFERAPAGAMVLAANDHGARFLAREYTAPDAGPPKPDYIVCCDSRAEDHVRPWGVPIVANKFFGDFRLMHRPGNSSGIAAAWVARLMGCSPILLIGMDCYTTPAPPFGATPEEVRASVRANIKAPTYFDYMDRKSAGHLTSESVYLRRWRAMTLDFPAQYRVLGGSQKLLEMLGAYDPAEPVAAPEAPERLALDCAGRMVRTVDGFELGGRWFDPGIWEVTENEAKALRRKRLAVLLP